MDIREINLTKEQIDEFLSETAKTFIKREGSLVYGAMGGNDNDILLAMALITLSDSGEEYILNHIEALDPGNEPALKEVFAAVIKFCKDRGQKRLAARFIDSQDNLQRIHKAMDLVPHKPLVLNGHRMVYGMEDVFPEELLKKHGNLVPLMKMVRTTDEVPRLKFNKFYEMLRQVGKTPYIQNSDEDFDRYFEYRGNINGYINSSRTANELLLLADSFVFNRDIRQYAYPAMLASVLLKAKIEIPDDGRVILQLYEEPIYNGVKIMLGEPSFEELIFEYMIMI